MFQSLLNLFCTAIRVLYNLYRRQSCVLQRRTAAASKYDAIGVSSMNFTIRNVVTNTTSQLSESCKNECC
jgi:hypothetical protein